MEMPKLTPSAERLFHSLVAMDARLEPRTMFGQPAAFVRGHLCLGAFGNDVFLRLSPADVERAGRLKGARPFEPMPGRPMRGYQIVPMATLREARAGRDWVGRAVAFTLTLPPKTGPRRR